MNREEGTALLTSTMKINRFNQERKRKQSKK